MLGLWYKQGYALSADGCSLNKQQKACRSFVSPLPEWKLLQSTAGVPGRASARNKWRQKLSAINTYRRAQTYSNHQCSAWSISDHYCVISVGGGCKVVLAPLVIDRTNCLWAEFQLAHKTKTYFSWQVQRFQPDSLHSCLLPVWIFAVPQHTGSQSGVNRGRWRELTTGVPFVGSRLHSRSLLPFLKPHRFQQKGKNSMCL